MKVESNAQNKRYMVNWLIDWAVFNMSINTVQVIWETVLVLHEVNSTTMEPFQNVTTYHVDLEVWSSHQILLILCACNVWEDVIKRVRNDTFLLGIALNTCHQWNAAAQHIAMASANCYTLSTDNPQNVSTRQQCPIRQFNIWRYWQGFTWSAN